jgi:hyperosmotically inducible protein
MNRSRIAVAAGFIAAVSFAGVAGCHEEGPAERAGKALDQAAEDAQEGIEDLTDDEGALERAGEATDEALDDAGEAVDNAYDKAKEATQDAIE